jgi:hypothetical protein
MAFEVYRFSAEETLAYKPAHFEHLERKLEIMSRSDL